MYVETDSPPVHEDENGTSANEVDTNSFFDINNVTSSVKVGDVCSQNGSITENNILKVIFLE